MTSPVFTDNRNSQELRVIEALRTGVPGRSAVRMLGTTESAVRAAFESSLERSKQGHLETGFLIEAGFGCGKSHQLASLQEIALDNNFACSIVSVSKEMSLATLQPVFLNAVRELRLPGKSVGGTCAEFVDRLKFDSEAFADLVRNYAEENESVNALFGSTLQLFERYQRSADVLESIIDFWDGGACSITDIKRDLKAVGLSYLHLRRSSETKIGLPRLQFMSDLLVAAGYAGWVILIDEAEMIAKLGTLSRAKSYVNLASLLGAEGFYNIRSLVAVAAITDDLWRVLLDERRDRTEIPRLLGVKSPALSVAAVKALGFLYDSKKRFEIKRIDAAQLRNLFIDLARIYSVAYPEFELAESRSMIELDGGRNIRSYLKEWITEWDLRRIYPGYSPDIRQVTLEQDLSESDDYEVASSVA